MKIQKKNHLNFMLMKKEYGKKINFNTIQHISKYYLWKAFRKENSEARNIYLRNIVSEWLDNFEGKDEVLFSKLKKILRKTKIKLTDIEKDGLFILEERAFSEIRQIKIIEVNTKLRSGENVGVKYVNAYLYNSNGIIPKKVFKGDILISNKRVIFVGYDRHFNFSEIKGYSNKKDGLELLTKNQERFLIRIHDSKTLNNTFNNIINRKVKNDIKKY